MNGQEWDLGRNQEVSGNKWKWIHSNSQLMGHRESTPEREIHSDTGQPKKDRKFSNKQHNPTPTRAQRTTTKTAHSK